MRPDVDWILINSTEMIMQVHQSLPSVNRNLGDVPDQDISRKWNSESYLYNGEQDESAVLVEFDSVVLQEYCLEL